jgi:hypothetical protein
VQDYKTAMENEGKYECSCNFAWASSFWSTAPGVPILEGSIRELGTAKYLNRDDKKALNFTVAVTDKKADPMTQKGALKIVSPLEDVQAVWWALNTDMRAPDWTAAKRDKWLKLLLTAKFTFQYLPTQQEQEMVTLQQREDHSIDYHAMTYTPIQWVYKVISVKKERELVDGPQNKTTLKKWFDKLTTANTTESISETFVENVLYIHKWALCYTVVQEVLIRGAELWLHLGPFNSVSKIADIIRKCKQSEEKIKWAFTYLLDYTEEGYYSTGDLSNNKLFGDKNYKGELDFMLSKLELKDHLLDEFIPSLNIVAGVASQIRKKLDSVGSYREVVPRKKERSILATWQPDLSWQGRWTPSAKQVFFCFLIIPAANPNS